MNQNRKKDPIVIENIKMVENSLERSSKKSPHFKEFEEKKEHMFYIDPA